MTSQPQNNNLNYLIDPTFTKVKRLFVLWFARTATGDHRDSFSQYYITNIEIKYFNLLIDGKNFFDLPVKNKKLMRKLWLMIVIMTTRLVIYWILLILKKITD